MNKKMPNKKMNKKIDLFNKKIYIEGLKQLKVSFVFFGIILGLYSIFAPFDYSSRPLTISGHDINPLFYCCFFIIVPVMTETLFKFLNNRNSSDFYHSIPVKRTTLMFSYSLSIITSIIMIMAVNCVVFCVLCKILCTKFSISTSTFIFIINILIASFYIHSCIMLSKSVTGTFVSNILLALMILFLPRLFIYVITDTIYSLNFMATEIPGILLPGNNLVIGTLNDGLSVLLGINKPMFSVTSGIYTLIIALIYYTIALWLFKIRKSETSSSYAPNKALSCLYRILLTYSVTLIPIKILSEELVTTSSFFDYSFEIVLFYCFALIAYYAYEAIATKSIKKSLKSSKGLLAVLALNILTIAICFAGTLKVKSFQPDADEIDSVCLTRYHMYVTPYSSADIDYYDYVMANTEITDEKILEYVASQLKKQINDYEDWDRDYTHNTSPYYTVIKCNGKEYKRKIYFPVNMLEEYCANDAYQETLLDNFRNLPEYPGFSGTHIYVHDVSFAFNNDYELSSKETKQLYNSIRKELLNTPKEKVFDEIIVGNNKTDNFHYSSTERLCIYLQMDNRTVSIPIDIGKLSYSYDMLRNMMP